MAMPNQDRFVRLLALAILVATAWPSAPARACDLPLDPYVVGLPDEVNGRPINQFDGWVETPEGWQGYVVVPAGQSITWKIYWDPTQGRTKDGNLSKIPPGITPEKPGFKLTKSGTTCGLFDLAVASVVLQAGMNNKPMKIAEVYGRDPTAGGWDANKYRVTAPWEIPAGNVIKTIEQPAGFVPTLAYHPSSDASRCAQIAGATITNGSDFVNKMFGSDTEHTQHFSEFNGNPSLKRGWRIAPNPRPAWQGLGGTWDFVGVEGLWNFDVKNTGKNAAEADRPGTFLDFTFDTPSDPCFYYVKPLATFKFNIIMSGNEYYEWVEEEIAYDDTGNVTDSPTPPLAAKRTCRITAGGQFSKGGAGQSGGVPTMVLVQDTRSPLHVHNQNPTALAFNGVAGKADYAGSAKFTIVDDNPYAGTNKTWTTERQGSGAEGRHNLAGSTAEIFYSMPVNEFKSADLGSLTQPPSSDFDVSKDGANAKFLMIGERWKWFKSATTPTITWKRPYEEGANTEGAAVADCWGNKQNPRFTIGEVDVPASAIQQPLPIHQVDANTGVDRDGMKILPWKRRFKFFVKPTDACANTATLTEGGKGFDSDSPDADTEPTAASADAEEQQYEITGDRGPVEVKTPVLNINWQTAVASCTHPREKLGTGGVFGGFTDTIRPTVVLLVKDTKYDRTYVLNDHRQGWQNHAQAQAAYSGGTGTTTDNTAWPALLGTADSELIEFNDLGTNPDDFVTQVQSGLAFVPPATRKGLWVDEDTRLVFQVLAWDNVNWNRPIPEDKISWFVDDGPAGKTGQSKSTVEDLGQNRFEYVFRDPNVGGGASGGPAVVRVEVQDEAASPNMRKLHVNFNVASNQLKILTLEETRRNK